MGTNVVLGVIIIGIVFLAILSIQLRLPKEKQKNKRKAIQKEVFELISKGEHDQAKELLEREGIEGTLTDEVINVITKINSTNVDKKILSDEEIKGPVTLVDAPINDELIELLKNEKEIEAIKLTREKLRLSLVKSKKYIELLKEKSI